MDADGMFACSCGFRGFAGYLREYEYLTARRQWLADRIAEHAGPPDPATAQAYGIWPAGTPQPTFAPQRKGAAQTLLVTLGAGLLILAALVFVAVAWDLFGPIGQMAILAVITIVTGAAAIAVRHRVPRTAEALAVVAFALGLIVSAAAPSLGALPESWARMDTYYSLVICAVAVAVGITLGHRFRITTWVWLGWLSTPVLLASAVGILTGGLGPGQLGTTVAAVAYVALGAGLLAAPLQADRVPVRITSGIDLLVAVGLTFALLDNTRPTGAIVVVSVALLALLLLSDVVGARVAVWIGWPLLGFWLALVGLLVPTSTLLTVVVALAGVGLLFVVARWGIALAAVTAGVLWTAWLIGAAPAEMQSFFGVAGIGLFAFSLRRAAAPLAWFGALSLQAAFLLQVQDVPFFEVPTLVLASLLLVAGLLQARTGERRSLVLYGPALTAALLPTALVAWDQPWASESLIRFLVVMAAGVLCLLVGMRRHLLGLVLPATLAISIAATAQIWATLDTLPRWLALAAAGAALIITGARIEWVRGKRQQTSAWLHTLQ